MLNNSQTQLLYITIFTVATLFAMAAQKKPFKESKSVNGSKRKDFRVVYFLLSFFTLWLFQIFSDNGPDYNSYSIIISRITWSNYASFFDQEPVFNFILLILKTIFGGSIPLTIAAVKTITLLIVYLALYISRDRIDIGFSILCYILWAYLESFYLLPMLLATALIMIANAIFRIKGKKLIPFLLVILAAQVHNAAYLYLIVFIAQLFIGRVSQYSKLKRVIVFIGYIVVIFFSSRLFNLAANIVSGFHYNNYYGGAINRIGFLFIAMYLPLFFISYRFFLIDRESALNNIIFLGILTSAMIKVLSYSFNVIGRVEFLLLPLYTQYISEFTRTNKIIFSGKMKTTLLGAFLIAYILFRGYIFFTAEIVFAMTNYNFFNPFV